MNADEKRKVFEELLEGYQDVISSEFSYEDGEREAERKAWLNKYDGIKEPLIKDEKIRKAVRAWADYHNITEVNCGIGDWDHAGMCLFDSVLQLHSIRDRIVIQFFMVADKREKIKEGEYTIAELCGEEEE